MARERLKSPRARLFVALDLPDEVRAGLARWGEEALGDPALRRPDPDALHLTLAFLGYLPERSIEQLGAIIAAADGGAPLVELRDPVPLPPRGRPRLFALPADSPETARLQAEVEERLVAARLYTPEKRPFWPHITVARVRSEGRGSRRPMRVGREPSALPATLRRPFHGVRLTLYRSTIRPQGAEYTPLAQVELPRDGRQ